MQSLYCKTPLLLVKSYQNCNIIVKCSGSVVTILLSHPLKLSIQINNIVENYLILILSLKYPFNLFLWVVRSVKPVSFKYKYTLFLNVV